VLSFIAIACKRCIAQIRAYIALYRVYREKFIEISNNYAVIILGLQIRISKV